MKNSNAKKMDSFLPLAAFLCYCDASSGINAKTALLSLKHFQVFKKELCEIEKLLSLGLPFNLLLHFYKSPSKNFSKLITLLNNGNLLQLKKFYRDLLEEQRNELKKYAARANLTGMFFIVLAAIVPALFSAVVLLGNLLGFTFTPVQILLAFAIFFPLIDLLFLFYLDLTSPEVW